jgi:hypothetical protein
VHFESLLTSHKGRSAMPASGRKASPATAVFDMFGAFTAAERPAHFGTASDVQKNDINRFY